MVSRLRFWPRWRRRFFLLGVGLIYSVPIVLTFIGAAFSGEMNEMFKDHKKAKKPRGIR